MNFFTSQERAFMVALIVITSCGAMAQYIFKKYPHVRDIVNVMEQEAALYRVNINTASHDDLVALPFIGEYTARKIIRYRDEHGAFTALSDLENIPGIPLKNYKRFCSFLYIP